VQLRRASGPPEVRYPGGFKSTARNNVTYRLYRLMSAQALESEIASCYEVKAVECAKEVERLLSRKGIKASFFVEYPDVYNRRRGVMDVEEFLKKIPRPSGEDIPELYRELDEMTRRIAERHHGGRRPPLRRHGWLRKPLPDVRGGLNSCIPNGRCGGAEFAEDNEVSTPCVARRLYALPSSCVP